MRTSLNLDSIPKSLIKQFGCIRCEWRRTRKCITQDIDTPLPSIGICDDRIKWLHALLPDDYVDTPNTDRLYRDILLAIGNDNFLKYTQLVEDYDERIQSELDCGVPMSEISALYDQRDRFESWRTKYFNIIVDKRDAQVGRETKRVAEVKHHVLSPKDIFNTFADNRVKEIDVEVINDKKNN